MRTTSVAAKDLDMTDWRAEHYMAPTPDELNEATLAGFTSGSSGRPLDPRNQYLRHGREEVRRSFREGHAAGAESRAVFVERTKQ